MRILFTGASSFTGFWFVKTLAEAGHEIIAILTQDKDSYDGVRAIRIQMLESICEQEPNTSFGDDKFRKLVAKCGDLDLLCHHAACVTNYKSDSFNVDSAVESNTRELNTVLKLLADANCDKVLLTGTYSQIGEGGQETQSAFSPYNLSKSLTKDRFVHSCLQYKVALGHFVIPLPFGPWENDRIRFNTYAMGEWMQRNKVVVKTPCFIRDNIHVQLMAHAYLQAATDQYAENTIQSFRPSGYVETQGKFAERLATETRGRSGFDCEIQLNEQSTFSEPKSLTNQDSISFADAGLSEVTLWDEYIDYYLRRAEI